MKRIPKHIIKRLVGIVEHQYEVKRLVSEIEAWAGIEDITDDEAGWVWGMYIDLQGGVMQLEGSQKLLKDYMLLKKEKEKK